ncbi:hypothetical protein GUJ93_ZPchr0006g41641 [Zizania palustris]|uniref:mRNA decay factor PAT1 domain-containing protein n=1 Tax=Zizania palustris TaxID=103762 RepID=A0A8J5SUU6_ZIZPA|nr:hypothetical protein GUJ93_ZPchr0006g41641 [Zizania palustris]
MATLSSGCSLEPSGSGGFASSGDAKFDASQYAFFGSNVMEGVELGGLEEEDDSFDSAFIEPGCEEYPPTHGKDMLEDEVSGSFTDADDLAGTFSKLTRIINEPKHPGIVCRRVSISGQSFADCAQENGSAYLPKHYALEAEQGLGNNNWTQPYQAAPFADSRLHRTSSSPQQDAQYYPNEPMLGLGLSPLNRTSSYPQQETQYTHTEPISAHKSSFILCPPSGAISNPSPGIPHYLNMSTPATGFQRPMPAQNELHLPQFPHGGMSPGPLFSANMAHMGAPVLSNNNVQQNHGLNSGPNHGNGVRFTPTLMHHQLQRPNELMPSPCQHGMLPSQQSQAQFSQLPAQMLGAQHSSTQNMQMFGPQHTPQIMVRFNANFGMPDLSDPRARAVLHHGRQSQRYTPQGFEHGNMKMENGWPRFRSKYMSTEEIENMAKLQLAATHINDPYIDDYYHQACLARKSEGARLNHHFCPTLIRDPSSRTRGKDEPHAYLQVDALGRLPFSSIRRPRPLLDVEQASAPSDNIPEKSASKPLDQEPMLAARITIEDGLCLLLDVDDIDRLLQFSKQQDGGLQLRDRRQALLEQLAETLQLVDPLGPNKTEPLSPNDDLVFLRIVSLPKGRTLLSRYLQLVSPGSELARIVCMAVFRHLRFIFGQLPSDNNAAETTAKLATTVSSCILQMELSGISACLVAIVCSPLQPPLRPLGHTAGNGASVIIKSVLDQATELLTNQRVASSYSVQNRTLWQASFDAFFGLLMEYCMSKFDSMVHTVQMDPAATSLVSREMPIDLLRASLPHTNEHQRKQLLNFSQRSVAANSTSSYGPGNGFVASEYVAS